MPVEYHWDIETVQETADEGSDLWTLEITENDTADSLGEYMVGSVIDAINEAADDYSETEYSRLCLVRSHIVRGKVVEIARAYVIEAGLPPMFIVDGETGFSHDVPASHSRELEDWVADNTDYMEND